jgi:hypothetical protein
MLLTPEIVGQLSFFATVTPASRAINQLNGLIAGKTTWYGEGLLHIDRANPVASLHRVIFAKPS